MSWKISLSLERNPESVHVAERMVYAAAKAEGASELDAFAAGMAVRDAVRETMAGSRADETHGPHPIQIDLEYDQDTLVLLVGDPLRPGAEQKHGEEAAARVRH